MPTVQLTKKQYEELVRRGLIPPRQPSSRRQKGTALVEPSFRECGSHGGPEWVIPLKTASEANQRCWQAKSNRTREARLAVSRHLGRHLSHLVPYAEAYHSGRVIRVILTRLGGPRLDAMANLGPSLKAVEDAVALMLGADDGSPQWHAEARQEPGGPMGVRIELTFDLMPR